jgi:ubiquitin-like-conjugating enzyme ATG3
LKLNLLETPHFSIFKRVDFLMSGYFRKAREWAYPTLKNSAFLEKGVLTPEEFVRAGDELVFKCPTWQWEGGDPKRAKSHLPPDKQYLVTRNVPCQTRVASMENTMAIAADDDDGEDSDWLVSTVIKEKPIEDEFDILDEEGMVVPKESTPKEEEQDDEFADMEDFEDDNVLEDDAAAAPAIEEESNLVKVRTYDLSITYDKYYQTPRVWMMGYTAETHQPLTGSSNARGRHFGLCQSNSHD